MILAALLAAAVPQNAIEAERAFAAQAQTEGQWTAFRAWSATEGLMFAPKPTRTHDLLKDAKDPPAAVMWWPGRSWTSCDGGLAVNTGPWLREGGAKHGTFTTVWKRGDDGSWRWLADNGRDTPMAVPASDEPEVRRASCAAAGRFVPESAPVADKVLVQWEGRAPAWGSDALGGVKAGEIIAEGASADGSLHWRYSQFPEPAPKAYGLQVWQWDGRAHRLMLFEVSGVGAK